MEEEQSTEAKDERRADAYGTRHGEQEYAGTGENPMGNAERGLSRKLE